jgi:hypothetical protein
MIPDAIHEPDIATDLSFQLKKEQSKLFPELFKEIESK